MKLRYASLITILSIFCSCSYDINIEGHLDQLPCIYPDYVGVTVPQNIAPLNFHIEGDGCYGALLQGAGRTLGIKADDGDIIIGPKQWRELLGACDSFTITVCQKTDSIGWIAYRPFPIYVSADVIDPCLVYRLIPPLYGTWREIGIYQRDLQTYDETPIYQNTAYHGNCVNCHSFCNRKADTMLFHLRGAGGATYMMHDGQKVRLDTKTDSTIANFTYPYWHPTGRYVAFSVNDIFQIFHTTDPNRTEVIDDASDVVVYDIERNATLSCPALKSPASLETFPAFSPDGHTLYFCSAIKPDTLPEHYADVRYSICAIDFDPDSRTFGDNVDTLYNARSGMSMTVPRPSPDGRWLVTTLSAYGNFKIWHKDADLWLYDLVSRTWAPMDNANSRDVDSYHSWSSNSRWLVFSSRRDDGLYTRPYIVHIDDTGYVAKPFMLPQRRPKRYYTDLKDSYNIPEFVDTKVDLDTHSVVDWIGLPAKQVN